ncbi:hypothetical protein HHJ06_05465 [Akkermansia muciniphila]|nr:hypothetical protein [Akkermansia muciniphila]
MAKSSSEGATAWEAGRNGLSAGKFLLESLPGLPGDGRNMVLTAVNKGMAKDFVERELERVSTGTMIRYVSTLSGAFNVAVDRKLIHLNPLSKNYTDNSGTKLIDWTRSWLFLQISRLLSKRRYPTK